jgi:hypothetical protein
VQEYLEEGGQAGAYLHQDRQRLTSKRGHR